MAEVCPGRVPSLERVTTGVGSASGAETEKLNSLGTSSRPSWLGLSVSIALLSNTGISTLETPQYFGADSLLRRIQILPQYKAMHAFTNRAVAAVEETRQSSLFNFLQQNSSANDLRSRASLCQVWERHPYETLSSPVCSQHRSGRFHPSF